MFRQDNTCPALLFVTINICRFVYGTITLYRLRFQVILLRHTLNLVTGCSNFARRYFQNLG
jgi:hypothetical protein